jgi:outer membrane protein assembly factor BamB
MCRRVQGFCLLAWCCICAGIVAADEPSWTGFRGQGDSHSTATNLPLTWSDTQNVAWKKELPGFGQSSPVVWKDFIFVTSVSGENKEKLQVTCFKVDSGDIAWQNEFPTSKPAKVSDYISRGAPTPVVDADRVYAFFESGDVVALNHAGETVWTRSLIKDYGEFQGNHGLGSSLAQTNAAVIVLVDHSGPSYLLSLDKATGQNIWKKERTSRVSWSSPIVAAGPQGQEILISSNGFVECLSAQTGDLLWEVTKVKGNTVASPSVTPQGIVVGSSQVGDNLLIRRGGQGDVSATHVAWRAEGVSSSFGSPVVNGGRAFFVSKQSVLFAVDMEKGTKLWTQRLPDSTWASPIAVGDRVYFFCNNGTTIVIRTADKFEQLAENKLTVDDKIYGVAVTHNGFVIRNGSRLTLIQEKLPQK